MGRRIIRGLRPVLRTSIVQNILTTILGEEPVSAINALLLETGDNLLLETGDKLLLEN